MPPVNDDFANRIVLAASGGTRLADTCVDATYEAGEPQEFSPSSDQTVWYEFQPDTTGYWNLTISGLTAGPQGTYTQLDVFDGATFATMERFGQGTGYGSTSPFTARVYLSSAVVYKIQVSAPGFGAVNDYVSPSFDLTWAFSPGSRPANDDIANATVLTGASGTLDDDNTDATFESGEQALIGASDKRSLWYAWTAPDASDISFWTTATDGTCANIGLADSVITVLDGNDYATATVVAQNDDFCNGWSQVTFTPTPAATYYIDVSGYQFGQGTFRLHWGVAPVPGPTITNGASSPTTYTATITADINPNGAATTWRVEYGLTVAYGTNTSDVGIGSGSVSVPVARLIPGLTPATLYHYRIHAVNADGTVDSTDGTFTTAGTSPPANDDIGSAEAISGASGCVQGNNENATLEAGEAALLYNPGPGYGGGRTVWYEWTAPFTGAISFWTRDPFGNTSYDDPLYDTIISVVAAAGFGGPLVQQNEYSDCRNAYSDAYFAVTSGTTYWIGVDGYNGTLPSAGGYDINNTQAGPFRLCWGPPVGCQLNVTTGVASTGANIAGTVRNDGLDAEYWVQYGLTASYTAATAHGTLTADVSVDTVSRTLTGLTPNTLYHYRVCATTAYGTACGIDRTFTTYLGAFGGDCPVLIENFDGDQCSHGNWAGIAGDGIRIDDNQGGVLHTVDILNGGILSAITVATGDLYVTLPTVGGIQYLGWLDDGGNGYAAFSDAAGNAGVVRFDTLVPTVLSTVAASWADGDKLGFRYDGALGPTISVWQYTGAGPWVELTNADDATWSTGHPFIGEDNIPFDTDLSPYLTDVHRDIPAVGGRDCPLGSGPFFGEIGPPTGTPCFWNSEGLSDSLPVYDWSATTPYWQIAYPEFSPEILNLSDCPVWLPRMGITAHGKFDYYNDSWGWGWFDLGDGLFYYLTSSATWDSVFSATDAANGFFVYDGAYAFFVGPELITVLDNLVAAFPDATKFESGSFPGETRPDAYNVWRPVTFNDGRFDDLYLGGTCPPPARTFKPQIVRYT